MAKRPHLAPVLVGHGIVRIVRPRAQIADIPNDLAGKQPAGNNAIGAVGLTSDVLQHRVHVVTREAGSLAVGAPDGGLGVDLHPLGIERGQKRLDLVYPSAQKNFVAMTMAAVAASG